MANAGRKGPPAQKENPAVPDLLARADRPDPLVHADLREYAATQGRKGSPVP